MDRAAIAREGRRAEALEALTFERDRESALDAQLREIVLEEEGSRVDEQAFARMAPDDVSRVREALGAADEEDEWLDDADASDGEGSDAEIRRLQEEIERSRAAQHALEHYLEALEEIA